MEDDRRMGSIEGRIRCSRSHVSQQSIFSEAYQKCDHSVQISSATDMQQAMLGRVAALTEVIMQLALAELGIKMCATDNLSFQ